MESTDGHKIRKVVEEMQVQRLDPQANQDVPQPGHQSNVALPRAQPPQASPTTRNQGPGLYDHRTSPYDQYTLHNTHPPQDRPYSQPRAPPVPPPYGYPPMNGGYYEPRHTSGPSNPHPHSEYYPHRG
ncbi:hypothetical protein BS47DRAFT_1350243 [Hydnum rufescens UP504]|uniref:Uncharacterized protein n=1 Tax=Hydnum rufescens UP504 TaxID=1448309 RepID=A0A9P6DRI7_9AGAM|nr:hypothetical protein BS47DRAFT_1350243 [Hydnum rufescens UP504]